MSRKYKVKDTESTILTDKLVIIITGGSLIISLAANHYLLSITCICLLALLLGTRIWAGAGFTNLETSLKLGESRAFPQDTVRASLTVENNKLLPVSVAVQLLASAGEPSKLESALLSYGKLQHEWRLNFEQRGVYTLGPLQVSAHDLLGFYSVTRNFAETSEVVIYPQLLPFKDYHPSSREFFGSQLSRAFVEDPVLITGIRDYTYQSPAKNIHWKASSRTMTLQEKMLAPSAHIKSVIYIEVEGFQQAHAAAEFETMLEAAASLIVELDKRNITPGLMVNGNLYGDQVPLLLPGAGGQNVHLLLEKLARLKMEYNPDCEQAIEESNFAGAVSYITFCYSLDEKILRLSFRRPAMDIITFQDGVLPVSQPGVKIYKLHELFDLNHAGAS